MGEERRREHRIDGQLGGTAHEGRQQDGHFPVPVAGKRARGHDGRNAAPEPDEHGHKAAPGKADLAQQLVHNKSHARHVAGIFQNGKEEKQCYDNGQEAEHAAHARKHAVDDEAVHHGVDAVSGEPAVHKRRHSIDAQREQVAQPGADDAERQPEDQKHDAQKNGDGRVFARQHAVQPHAAQMLLAFSLFHHGLGAQLFNERIAHIGQRGFAVGAELGFHFRDGVADELHLIFRKAQHVHHGLVALHQFCGGKAHGHACGLGVVLHDVRQRMDAAVHRARTEILPLGQHFQLCGAQRVLDQLVDALVFRGGDGNHGYAQLLLQLVYVHSVAVGAHFIHHVQRDDHGKVQLDELHGQVKVSLDVGGVHDVDDTIRLFLDEKIPGDDLLAGVR